MNPPVGPNTEKLMAKLALEGASSPTFTKEEKLALVADELMAPEEVGLTNAKDAELQLLPDAKPAAPNFGNEILLQAGVIPLELRAEWAYQDNKIIMAPKDKTEWLSDWMVDNHNTYRVQGAIRCGNLEAKFERIYSDPVMGLADALRMAADRLEIAYTGKPVVAVEIEDQKSIQNETPTEPDKNQPEEQEKN
jgi:hypothetical protein